MDPGRSGGAACSGCGVDVDDRWSHCRVCAASLRWRRERGLAPLVVEVVLRAAIGSADAERLRWYKDADDAGARRELTIGLAADLASWLARRPDVLADIDVVTCVPSMNRCAPEAIVDAVPRLAARHRRLLAMRHPLHREHDPTAFSVAPSAAWPRVLVVDDASVSGASLLSASDALSMAGARVSALAIGRLHREQ